MEYRVFENLDLEIEYINIELAKGRSITKIAREDYGYQSESSLRKRLTKGNLYKRVGQQFIKINNKTEVRQDVRQDVTMIDNSKVECGTELIEVKNSAMGTPNIFEDKYKGLLDNYDVLIQMIDEYKKSGIAVKGNSNLVIELPQEEEEARVTFRINGTVYEEFQEFVKSHKQFKVKELVSAALKEFVEKYSD